MKCPKCHYLSFEASDRCRNCGYDFSLASAPAAAAGDASIDAADESITPLDLTLAPRPSVPEPGLDLDRMIGVPARSVPDLPLFAQEQVDDAPLITARATPRPPLAVRRPADTGRGRAMKMRVEPEPELALEMPVAAREEGPSEAPTIAEWGPETAGWGRRAFAAAIDAAIVGGIDALVVYFTLQVCGLSRADALTLPLAPLVAFLAMLDGGYFVAFTAMGGQTIGKMAAGIQVVGDRGPIGFSHAFLRAAAYVVSLAPAGLGLIPAFFGAGRRTLHDRLADTRVVRA